MIRGWTLPLALAGLLVGGDPQTPARGLGAASALVAVALASEPDLDELGGVRIGMRPDEVKQRFEPGRGTWAPSPGCTGALDWTPTEGGPGPRWARFEFHQGFLMAMRMRTSPDDPRARGPSRAVSATAVVGREATPQGETTVVVMTRTCREHQGEVAELIAGAPLRR